MTNEQENAFWETMHVMERLGITRNIMIIGSWAEYLYPPLFDTGYRPNLKTRDIDIFYPNINLPDRTVPLTDSLKRIGYVYDEVDGVSRFYKEDLLELEFLTRKLGAGNARITKIPSLGIKSEGLRAINMLAKYPCEITTHDTSEKASTLIVPEPATYVVQKILTNPTRMPLEKKAKDIEAIRELLYHIKQSDHHTAVLNQVRNGLSKRQSHSLQNICAENQICL